MIIDAHSHVHAPVASHIRLMDEAGVARSVLFGTRPHPERATDLAGLKHEMGSLAAAFAGEGDEAARFQLARREHHAAIAEYPDRFIGFGSVRLDQPAELIAAETAWVIGQPHVRGVGELTPPPGRAACLEPVLGTLSDHGGVPLVVHGFAPTTSEDLATIADLAHRHPTVPVVISQLGGLNWLSAIELAHEVPNLYLDLSTPTVIFAVRLAITELPDRVMFASDAPYGDPVLARTAVERVTRPGTLRDQVLGGTIAELLGW